MSQYFPPYKSSSSNIKVELDLTNYVIKTDLKNITHTDVRSFASKTNLAALKTEVDKIDVDKLKTVPDDLAKLSNVVKNEVVKKTDFSADAIHHQLQYVLGSFGLTTQAPASMYVSSLIQFIISCSTHWAPLVPNVHGGWCLCCKAKGAQCVLQLMMN